MQAPLRAEWVVDLHAVAQDAAACVGTKAATLGLLAQAGLAVPEGLALTCAAWDEVREAGALGPDATAAQVLAAALPDGIVAAIDSIAHHFGDATLAVRSSAAEEDSPDSSYAGQFETVLDVRGADALREAIRRCWASAFSEQVRAYRSTRGRDAAPVAVLVQRQVEADVAGVAFTADPVTGARDGVLVSAVPGLGDALVSGRTEPDEWVVRGTAAAPVRVLHQALAAAQAQSIAELALRIEDILGAPQDVEWAMADGRLVVLQARPITALPEQPELDVPPGTWIKESDRHPEPLTAFGASLAAPVVARGLSSMFEEYGGLLDRMETRSIGGEPYLRPVPLGGHDGPPPPWWVLGILSRLVPPMRRRMCTAKRMMRPDVLDGVVEHWYTVWQPQFRRTAERLHAVELTALDDAGLADYFDSVRTALDETMDVHFRLIPPYLIPVHELITATARLLGWSEAEALSLLAGTSQATLEPVVQLDALAREIRRSPAARAAVEQAGADLAERLTEADTALGAAFAGWCERYAYRNVNDDPGSPVLAELPWLLASLLRDATRADDDGGDSAQATRAAAAERARAKLGPHPQQHRDAFERVLAAALSAYPVREDSAFWTGSVFGGCARLYALEAGRRLVARGALDRADDAVHLPANTLRAALLGEGIDDVRAQARRARAEREWVRRHPGPPFHGPPPQPVPDVRGLPKDGRRLNAALLWMQRRPSAHPAATAEQHVVVAGVPAAPGRYTGPVRVVSGAAELGRLRPGDVLVCPTTDPAWTVLFGIAGALVTDGGGVLSHAAIVAREYAVPAVVGTGDATRVLRDGQVVTVDGDSGRVVIETQATAEEGQHP